MKGERGEGKEGKGNERRERGVKGERREGELKNLQRDLQGKEKVKKIKHVELLLHERMWIKIYIQISFLNRVRARIMQANQKLQSIFNERH